MVEHSHGKGEVPGSSPGLGSLNFYYMDELKKELAELEQKMARPDFWGIKEVAQETVNRYQEIKAELAGENRYDQGSAIMTIFAGAGGVDAEDFARILLEMYHKFADNKNFKVILIHQNTNDHGGYRNITVQFEGRGAYGILKNESGVHRLVRISPFNAKKLRHTSFCLVEVIPKFDKPHTISIPDEDLKIEFAKSGGPGGQNVNKRETAVRIVHLPTNIAVHCDSERSQVANREKALTMLEGKLYRVLEEDKKNKEEKMYISKTTEIEWGNQIRSYVFHPYKLIKDHRTEIEETDIQKVLDGDLDKFIEAEKNLN